MLELEIKILGRVQGINMRNTIKGYCDSNSLNGYVMNTEEGSVLTVVQGEEEKLNEFVNWIKASPGFSKVCDLFVEKRQVRAKYDGFEIIREGNFFLDKVKSLTRLGRGAIIENESKIPEHVVIIPDGNRRWAREKGLHASFGHYTAGSKEHIVELIGEAKRLGVKYLSIWGFSTENWNRDEMEIKAIFDLVLKNVNKFYELAEKHNIRFRHIGRKDRLTRELKDALDVVEEKTANFNSFNVLLCLDYGGRDEIMRAVNKALESGKRKIDEKEFTGFLDTKGMPDPDLIIRTSGERRTSGFMPFQAAYAEFYFTKKYFPEFGADDLRQAVVEFGNRTRRYGATAAKDIKMLK